MGNQVRASAENVDPYFQSTFSIEEFQRRRSQVCESIGDAVAIIQGSAATGAMDIFRQHNDFFYLCGVEIPHAYLSIDGRKNTSTLYLPPLNKRLVETDGPELNADEAEVALRLTGVDKVKPLSALKSELPKTSVVYLCHQAPEGKQAYQDSIREAEQRAKHDPLTQDSSILKNSAEKLRHHLGQCTLRDLSPIINDLRRLKSSAEIEVLRRAGAITALALSEAIRSTQPGIIESQLAAVADYVFLLNGARGGGYRPIVASGANTWNMHYYRNNCRLKDGDLVLFDYAPDIENYTSDIGRMWPVNGKFSPGQRELYGFVVDYHLTLLELIEPGKTPAQIRAQASERVRPIVSKTKWSKPCYRDAVEKLVATSRAFTHSVGMAVHDDSGYQEDDRELEPGLVFALDPQLWVPEERLYVRVEDCVVVDNSGAENFTKAAPHTPDEIEKLMAEPGLLQIRPDLCLEKVHGSEVPEQESSFGRLAVSPS